MYAFGSGGKEMYWPGWLVGCNVWPLPPRSNRLVKNRKIPSLISKRKYSSPLLCTDKKRVEGNVHEVNKKFLQPAKICGLWSWSSLPRSNITDRHSREGRHLHELHNWWSQPSHFSTWFLSRQINAMLSYFSHNSVVPVWNGKPKLKTEMPVWVSSFLAKSLILDERQINSIFLWSFNLASSQKVLC